MTDQKKRLKEVRALLIKRLDSTNQAASILRAKELRELYALIPTLDPADRATFGQAVNELKEELEQLVNSQQLPVTNQPPIDVTAPSDINIKTVNRPKLLPTTHGSQHPLMRELDKILDIFTRMGFDSVESRQIDDDYHMFETLNFPEGHPAKDDYDTFVTVEKDPSGKSYIAPAHTSTMQNRVLKAKKGLLKVGEDIRVVIPGRVFRNEDLDARHEHTFYQLEGVYVGRNIHAGHLVATLKEFLEEYYEQAIDVKMQPYYFPFTEPSFEFALSCPFCRRAGCHICSRTGWIELLGCGMIHPNVLKMAGIDASYYTGFAWGGGIERLVMMKHGIEDIRHFQAGKLEFLRQFS